MTRIRLGVSLAAAALAVLLPPPVAALDFNLVANGEFDSGDGVTGWLELTPENSFMDFDTNDADACVGSGSVEANNSTADTDFANTTFYVCVPVQAGQSYRLTGAFLFQSNVYPSRASASFSFANTTNCTDSLSGGTALNGYLHSSDPGAFDWRSFATDAATAPAGAKSARVHITLIKNSGADPVVYLQFDKIHFTTADYIFSEDFEFDAVACRWSAENGFPP